MSHTIKKSVYYVTTPTGLYEGNFRRLMRLMPKLASLTVNDSVYFQASQVTIQIKAQHKYTSIITLQQNLKATALNVSTIDMELRVCHDAVLVEVIGYQGNSPVQSALTYPNKNMWQVDEKKQLNLLLKDILENAIKSEHQLLHSKSPCN